MLRVELKKLHIGNFSASFESQGNTIAGGYIGVCSVFKQSPGTSGGQNGVSTFIVLAQASTAIKGSYPPDFAVVCQNLDSQAVFEDFY